MLFHFKNNSLEGGRTKIARDDTDWEVASRRVSRFFKFAYLLKLVAGEVAAYLLLYYAINVVYRFVLDERQKAEFDKVSVGGSPQQLPPSFYVTHCTR